MAACNGSAQDAWTARDECLISALLLQHYSGYGETKASKPLRITGKKGQAAATDDGCKRSTEVVGGRLGNGRVSGGAGAVEGQVRGSFLAGGPATLSNSQRVQRTFSGGCSWWLVCFSGG